MRPRDPDCGQCGNTNECKLFVRFVNLQRMQPRAPYCRLCGSRLQTASRKYVSQYTCCFCRVKLLKYHKVDHHIATAHRNVETLERTPLQKGAIQCYKCYFCTKDSEHYKQGSCSKGYKTLGNRGIFLRQLSKTIKTEVKKMER